MTREFLKSLGLSEEVIDKVMADYGKSVNQLKAENEELKAKTKAVDDLEKSKKDLEDKLEAANNEIKAANEKLSASESDFTAYKNNTRLDAALKKAGFKSSDLAKRLIDVEKLKFGDDKIEGLDEAIAELKKNSEYLFENEKESSTEPSVPGMKSHKPEISTGETKSEMESQIDAIFNK